MGDALPKAVNFDRRESRVRAVNSGNGAGMVRAPLPFALRQYGHREKGV
jgi:hypothetical protein